MESDKDQPENCQLAGGVSIVSSFNSAVSFVPFKARPLSCSAAAAAAASTTATTTNTTPTSSTTVTPPRPVSCGSVTYSSYSARTLVQPRAWRFLHRSKMGNAQATGEDYTLEGDSDQEDGEGDDGEEDNVEEEDEEGSDRESSVDRPASLHPAPEIVKHNGDYRMDVTPDTANTGPYGAEQRTDVAPKAVDDTVEVRVKHNGNGVAARPEPETKASLSTIPERTPISIFHGKRSTLPESRRARLPLEAKVVKFMDLETPRRPQSEGSPNKKIVLNAQENAVKISFSTPITMQSPTPVSPTSPNSGFPMSPDCVFPISPNSGFPMSPDCVFPISPNSVSPFSPNYISPVSPNSVSPKFTGEKPPVPQKPALTRSKSDSTESPSRDSFPSSPASPVEDVLFSLGYMRVEDTRPPAKTPKRISPDKKMDETSPVANPDKSILDRKLESPTTPYSKPQPITVQSPEPITIQNQKPEPITIQSPKPEPVINPARKSISNQEPDDATTPPAKPERNFFIDKTAERDINRAAQREPPSEPKPKPMKKVKIEDVTKDKSKEHVKLFPWKVEFSAKASSDDESVDSWQKGGTKMSMVSSEDRIKEDSLPRSGSKSKADTPTKPDHKKPRGLLSFMRDKADKHKHEATTKKADKADGAKTPPDKKPTASPGERPPQPLPQQQEGESPSQPPQEQIQEDEEERQEEEQQLQQQQQQQQQVSQLYQPPPGPPPPKPPHLEDMSSSDTQNSDIDSLYGSVRRNQLLVARQGQISESDGEVTPQGTMRKLPPRRHTVGGAQIHQHFLQGDETERKREAFYELLAQRYPQYADKITGMAGHPTQGHPLHNTAAERNPRAREPQRRRTTAVVYSPHGNPRALDYEDPGTMSDIELSSFQRGGYARASLPIVRSASSSLERPLGLVFLVYRDETKKALLPNEITTLDTVRALFVRAFPEKLGMEFLDSPKRKIYILEAATSIFFQLEDLRDIKDRTVLRIHECDSTEPQRVRTHPEVRGRSVQQAAPSSRPTSRQGFPGEALYREEIAKTQSLPVASAQSYQELMQKERLQWEMEQNYMAQSRRSRSRSLTPEPPGAERPRSLSTGAPRTRFSHSPDRMTPDRAAYLNPIPENPRLLANGFREAMVNGGHYDPHHPHHSVASPTSHHPPGQQSRVLSPTSATGPIYESVYATYAHPQSYVSHSKWAAPPSGPQRATGPQADMRGRREMSPANRHSLAFAAMSGNMAPVYDSVPQRSQSYRVTPERDVLPPRPSSTTPHDPETRDRMERMEAQIATLAAWVHHCQVSPTPDTASSTVRRGPGSSRSTSSTHSEGTDTYPGSSASSLSDIPTAAYSVRQPMVTGDMKDKIADVQQRLRELRKEMQGLRRMEQLNQEAIRDAFSDTLRKIKRVMTAVPGAENQVIRHQRAEVNVILQSYKEDKECIEKELGDLEQSVEELREDVIARRCRVSVSDVEGFALQLSNITKSLAALKGRFPEVHESLKGVMAGEMEIVVKEERFIKEEPLKLEAALKRCKRLTSTLYTLKRLASVQDTRPLNVPAIETKDMGDGEKMAILESIRAMVPDHETRVQSLEAADASRERKKKIVAQQESLKFAKSLQTASKALKHTPQGEEGDRTDAVDCVPKSESDSRNGSVSSTDGKYELRDSGRVKSPPPEVPTKPARQLSSGEGRKSDSGRTDSVRSDTLDMGRSDGGASSVTHTVTVTSQMSEEDKISAKMADQLGNQRSAARLAFFSSIGSPDTSPTSETDKPSSLTDKTQSSTGRAPRSAPPTSLGSIPVSSTSSKASGAGVYFQAVSPTRARSAFSSIPLPSKPSHTVSPHADKDEGGDGKPKKVPPPPPPRKSSTRLPFGFGGGSSTVNGGSKGDKSPDGHSKKTSPTSSGGLPGPMSSTPKPATPAKPMNKFQRDLAAGIYANMNRPDLQNQKVTPERIINSMASPPPAAVTTNSQDLQSVDEQDLSGSESTGSSTSLDSQLGVALLRSNSAAADCAGGRMRGRPEPPQRHSSLLVKGSGSEDAVPKTKTQMLQERRGKWHEAGGDKSGGSKFSQVNGLNGAKDGHKT